MLDHVFTPRRSITTLLLALTALRSLPPVHTVAEPGCGTNTAGLIVAKSLLPKRLIATDISTRALYNAKLNARLNRLDAIVDYALCNWLDCIRPKAVDASLLNPPYLPCPYTFSRELCGGLRLEVLLNAIASTVKASHQVLLAISSLSLNLLNKPRGSKTRIEVELYRFEKIYVVAVG